MQPSLLKFFSRNSKPVSSGLSQNNCDKKTKEIISDKSFTDVKQENKEPEFTRPRRRIIYESSDEENADDSLASESLLNISASSKDNVSSPNPSLSAFACSSPRLVCNIASRDLDPTSKNGNPKDNPEETSLNITLMDPDFEAPTTWEHLNLPFLQPEKLMDGLQRRPNHPDYDCRTLYVPKDFLAKQSPAMRQWWDLKSRYADVVLLFKVGKFYELYHMDATIAVNELGLVYMRGSHAHCGFPEVAFPRMANGLVKKGYKVGRVEQTESVEAMTERTRGRPGSEKVVRREVCQLLTPGTCTATDRAEISNIGHLPQGTEESTTFKDVMDDSSSFLIAVSERSAHHSQKSIFGVSLLNAANGMIMLGQFVDDSHYSRLRTLFAHYPPSQVLVERGGMGHSLKSLLKTCLSGIPVEHLARGKQFWSAKDTISELESAEYFTKVTPRTIQSESQRNFAGKQNWPLALLNMLSEDDPLGRSVKSDADLAISCFGAVIYYLRYCLIDREVLSLGYLETYVPPDMNQFNRTALSDTNTKPFYCCQPVMVLDSITLGNLDILQNTTTGTREGTLIERLDSCCTSFGRRLFRQWLTAPPCNPVLIRHRQDAIENLVELLDRLGSFREGLRRLPDFERLITKIHLLGSKGMDKDHPDNRAILFEEVQYSRKNILDFVATLDGFAFAYRLLEDIRHLPVVSEHLKSLVTLTEHGGTFPSLQSKISYFKNAFDVEKAKRDGRIIPEPGVDADYDAAVAEIKCINDELAQYLMASGKRLGVRLVYWGTGRNRFQIEVPDSSASRVPNDWRLSSQRKGCKRYRTTETQNWLNQLISAEERKDVALRGIMRTIFTSFSKSFSQWHLAMKCLAELDCLLSLAVYSTNASTNTCRPEFVELSETQQEPFLDIEDGLHPCLINTFMGGDVIPNSVRLGSPPQTNATTTMSTQPLTVLVTGPNMGGKSTLMRQTALLVILAHLGCRIPAASCRLTPVDRIFSRLGASDRLLAGESTFLVELSETAAILRHATRHSLVLMDELGRGTSTHDGAALASAVLRYLANPSGGCGGPRTLFSTHYHSLVDEVAQTSRNPVNLPLAAPIGLGHMACMVEEQANAEPGLENITFLYKFIPGACPKSYGFNAARLAHLPDKVIQLGLTKAKEFERTTATFACLRTLLSGSISLEEAKAWRAKLEAF